MVSHLHQGHVAATIYQRPVSQGRHTLRALYQFLLDDTKPPARIKVVPHVVMRSNLELLLDRRPLDNEKM
jgi:ABC-type sugar transport system substrate-binding protein